MKAKLQIRNFGPIKNIDIEISKFNILIGPHASGKSTIAKTLAIIQYYLSFTDVLFNYDEKYNVREIRIQLNYYRIENFLNQHTYWFFENEKFSFELAGENFSFSRKVNIKKDNFKAESYYFPAERVALPMISESLFELTLAQSTLPGYFLQFGKDFTLARKTQALFNIPILGVEFEHKDGNNIITISDSKSLLLEETSSAIQASLPLLVILQSPMKDTSLFVIEELELHGFPTLQKNLLYYIIERMKHPKLSEAYVILPTHSPYILSAANNLLFAAKVAKQNKDNADIAGKIISKDSWIDRDDFSAYYIENGKATSIVNEKTGLIDENELDGISENLAGEFDALMELYKPVTA